jgi:hypothetical protein
LIHICRAAYENQWLVGKNDFENGFNSLSRQKMLDTHCALFPESTDVFNFFYGVDSPVFLLDDELQLCVLRSEEGSRQGCAAGTEAFCLGINPVLIELQARYPEFEFRAVTDDVVPIVPPPASGTFDDWQALYVRYAHCLNDIAVFSLSLAGLRLNQEKGALLLPAGAPFPTPEVRALFPKQFEFRQDGMRIAGSPVGTDAFMRDFVQAKVVEASAKLAAIKLVGRKSPHAAHRLLSSCGTKLLCFLAATVPPNICLPFLHDFDSVVEQTFFEIISPTAFTCSQERMDRAKLKASLPSPIGCGLFKSSDQGGIAWWASVSACLSDPLVFKLRYGLTRFADGAWQALLSMHGGPNSKYWSQVKHLYPADSSGLLNGTRYSPLTTHTEKTNKSALKTVSKIRLDTFQKLHAVSLLSDENHTLTPSDVIHASCRSFSGRIFSEPLKKLDQLLNFGPEPYTNFCRFFLALPPAVTLGNATVQAGFDYPVQRCLAVHSGTSQFLDANANHASSGCPATCHSRNQKHRSLMRVINNAAHAAGLHTRYEPDTHSLLLGEFSKADCRRVFPKTMSKAYKSGFEKVSQAADFIASASCTLSFEEKQNLIQSQIDLLPIHQGEASGLRIDLCLENPDSGETKWVDTTVVHTTCASYENKELKAVSKRNLSAAVASAESLPDALQYDPSPSLIDREIMKVEKYSRLVLMAKKQHADGKRTVLPTFAPFVVSDFGELSPAATDLQEWIVEQFRRKCVKNKCRTDGCSTSDLVRQFRHKFKVDIQFAIAAGLGAMIQAAGQPWGGLGPA